MKTILAGLAISAMLTSLSLSATAQQDDRLEMRPGRWATACGPSDQVIEKFTEDGKGEIVLRGMDIVGEPFIAIRMKDATTFFFVSPEESKGEELCLIIATPGDAMKVEKSFGKPSGIES